jgi:hypothetical protein
MAIFIEGFWLLASGSRLDFRVLTAVHNHNGQVWSRELLELTDGSSGSEAGIPIARRNCCRSNRVSEGHSRKPQFQLLSILYNHLPP